jgi:hypothetical protein
MGYPAKIQQITSKDFNQYYINFPRAIAMAINFKKSDPMECEIAGRDTLTLERRR